MSYYIRVLAEKADIVPVATIRQWLQEKGLEDMTVVVEDGDEASWNEISLRRKRRRRLVVIERNPVTPGSLGAEEIQEFLEEVSRAKPKSGADWLREYLPRVRAVYAFQLLFDISSDADWQVVHEVQGRIWETLGGDPPGGRRRVFEHGGLPYFVAVFRERQRAMEDGGARRNGPMEAF